MENQETAADLSDDVEVVVNLSSLEGRYLDSLLKALETAPSPWIADRIEVLAHITLNTTTDKEDARPPIHFAPRVEDGVPQDQLVVCPECGGRKSLEALLCRECDLVRQKLIHKGEEPKRVWKCKQCKEIPVLTKGRLCPGCTEANLRANSKLCDCGTRISPLASQCARCQAFGLEEPSVKDLEAEPEVVVSIDRPKYEASFVAKVITRELVSESGEAFGKSYVGMRAPTEGPSLYRGQTIPTAGITGRRCPIDAGVLFIDREDKDYEYCLCGFRRITVVPMGKPLEGVRKGRTGEPRHAHQVI